MRTIKLHFYLIIADKAKHLRCNNLTNLDIKPGIIFTFVNEYGTSHYKLGDLGTGRALMDDQEFDSIHDTPDYLVH